MAAWDAFWASFFFWLGVIKWPLLVLVIVIGSWWLMRKSD